ncbi:hypothetical protein FSP39_005178 [Pinctada imbricata]|uniref:Glucocorticoid-induced transcript 1 protein n=1 Tax=Pinctada imbricata TaxID=66713 RepID=A0AA88YLS7_PINIB|nr:hypothetical protein FSP39_005178 [Pinctada imbricata]
MSGQTHHKVRRNVSPATIPRPMKAKIPFSLKGSPTRKSPTSSPTFGVITLPRRSPDNRNSPERRSPGSTSPKVTVTVERPKAVRVGSSPLRRTGSLEAICTSYVKGQWPSSQELLSSFMVDKCTQTEKEDLEVSKYNSLKTSSKKKKSKDHRRSRSFGPGDQQQLALIRQKLQKSKEGSRHETSKLRQSPVPANHQALLSTAPAVLQNISQRSSKPLGIPSHIPKNNFSKIQRNSVEGLNTEIEKLVFDKHDKSQDIPDGHRAPIPESPARGSSTRSVDTQTPGSSGSHDDPSPGSRSQSVSPGFPIIPGAIDTSRPSSGADSGGMERLEKGDGVHCESPDFSSLKIMSSPRPNKSYAFVREPPDGCEKVKVITEDSGKKTPSQPSIKEPLFCPKNPSQFIFKPSADSAFCPLRKIYATQGTQSTGTQVAAPVEQL